MARNYRTEAPFIVTTVNGSIRSVHFSSTSAIAAAMKANGGRVIHGRHQGVWKELVQFKKGVKA